MIKEENKNLDYWKANAEEDYMQVPISVLRYISELETAVKNCSIPDVVKSLPLDTDGCNNDRSKCSCKDWGGCPVD